MHVINKITESPTFLKQIKKLDNFDKERLKKQINKILDNPETGKPLKYLRGERTIYIKPFRLIYALKNDELILLKFEHRKSVYD